MLTAAAASALTLEDVSGAISSLNGEFRATAGYAILYDAATAPAAGATLTPRPDPMELSVSDVRRVRQGFPRPDRGHRWDAAVASTSLTVYTAPANLLALLSGQVK